MGTTTTVYVATRRPGEASHVQLGLTMGGRIYPQDKSMRQVFKWVFLLLLLLFVCLLMGFDLCFLFSSLPWLHVSFLLEEREEGRGREVI